jgi:hypothetical protein
LAQRNLALVVGLVVGAALLAVHLVLGIVVGEDYALPATVIGSIAAAVVLRGPIGVAMSRRIQGPSGAELPPETVLGELDDLRHRLLELEERVDFSERLLVRERESADRGAPSPEA